MVNPFEEQPGKGSPHLGAAFAFERELPHCRAAYVRDSCSIFSMLV